MRRFVRSPLFSLCLGLAAAFGSVVVAGRAASAQETDAPELAVEPLQGSAAHLADFKGRPLVLDFWASWCEPCKAAVAEHTQLIARYGGRIGFVAIDMDEDPEAALRFMDRHPLAAPMLHDPTGKLAEAYGASERPGTVVIGPTGRITERIAGDPYPRLWSAVEAALTAGERPGCPGIVDRQSTAMGTRISIRLCPGSAKPEVVERAAEAALREVDRLEGLWSTWRATSEISRLNAAAGGEAVPLSRETFELLRVARGGSERFEGLFDVTFAPLGSLWTFDTPPGSHTPTRLGRVPGPAEIAQKRALVGYRGLVLTPANAGETGGTARLERPGMAVHLGGIGKGAAVDRMVAVLRGAGFADFCVQAGGDLYCGGQNGPRPWLVGIAHPRQAGGLIAALEVRNAAFSTSGDYERFAIIEGKRYHHILDPRTGVPATASQSATVLAATGTDAEILTKVAFILGGEAGLAALSAAGAKGVLVDADGRQHVSPGLPLRDP